MGDLLVPEDCTVGIVDGVRVVFTRAGLDAAGPPPQMPGNLFLRIQMCVRDDSGRELRKLDGQVAGLRERMLVAVSDLSARTVSGLGSRT